MKRFLFVDDEQRVLDGMQRMLRPQRHRWEMKFAAGGEAALAALEAQPFDVVVTDMRMPGTDGAQLLEIVRSKFPNIVRIVLSGYFQMSSAVRVSPVAHQFLVKPCDAGKLCAALERACTLSEIIADETTRRAVSGVGELPCLPRTYAALAQALEKPDVPLREIGEIVGRDVGISAKVLQLVNSAFFGLAREITTVQAAVGYLGLDTLKQLVLTVEVFQSFGPAKSIPGFRLEDMESHSRLTAAIAAQLPVQKEWAAAAPISALLHDVGELVLASRLPSEFEWAIRTAVELKRPLFEVEEEQLGASHAEIGAYLLGLWGLPVRVVDAVLYHHHPSREAGPRELTLATAVHVADFLAHSLTHSAGIVGSAGPVLDVAHLETLELADRIPEWTKMAEEVAAHFTEA
jgi:HD-like signal output (HDOD) protein